MTQEIENLDYNEIFNQALEEAKSESHIEDTAEVAPEAEVSSIEITKKPETEAEVVDSAPAVEDLIAQLPEEDREYAKNWRPDGKKTLEQYVHDGKFISQIEHQKKVNAEMEATLKEMKKLMKVQQEVGYKKALEELERKREDAILFGDVERVRELEKEIKSTSPEAYTPVDVQDILNDFSERNPWIVAPITDEEVKMHQRALALDARLKVKNLPPEEHLATVEAEIKKAFPEYFGIAPKEKENVPPPISPVASATSEPQSRGKKPSYNDLNAAQREVCDSLARKGLMTKDEYIKALIEAGEL